MWNLFTVGSLQFPNDSTIASLEANQSWPNIEHCKNIISMGLDLASTNFVAYWVI